MFIKKVMFLYEAQWLGCTGLIHPIHQIKSEPPRRLQCGGDFYSDARP